MEIPTLVRHARWAAAVAVAVAILAVLTCIVTRDARENGGLTTDGRMPMAAASDEEFPNYDEVENSPELPGPGVAVRLEPPEEGTTYLVGEPIILRGAVGANAVQHARSNGEILTKTIIKAVRAKDDAEHAMPADASGELVLEEIPEPDDPDAYEVYAWFNLDIRKALSLPDEPGEYSVQASFFEFVSDPLTFEVEFSPGESED
jgi:hypothetical protein